MKLLSYILLIFASTICQAQQVAISLLKQNVLYKNIDNPITIVARNENPENLVVSSNEAVITKLDSNGNLMCASKNQALKNAQS